MTVALAMISGDGKAHRALVRTTPPQALTVPAGRRATLAVPGQKAGAVTIVVDGGAGRASIVFGSQPGP